MRKLGDIIQLKANEIGGNAALAKKLGWGSEKNPSVAIAKYITGKTSPSIEFAVAWKKAFNENLIDLMFDDKKMSREEVLDFLNPGKHIRAAEPSVAYKTETLIEELDVYKTKLIACMEEKEELKKFLPVTPSPELKVKQQKK